MSLAARSIRKSRYLRLLLIAPLLLVGLLYFSSAYGAELLNRSITMSDARASATATYKLTFDLPGPETLGSIKLQFCSNSPLPSTPCTAPAGFDISAATLSSQTGEIGFSVDAVHTNANTIVLTRAPLSTVATTMIYELSGVINPSAQGTFYARLQTFASTDGNGPENDHGGMALSINVPIQISVTVPPYLLFCVAVTIAPFDCSTASGDYVNFGNLSSGGASSATTQMLTASNAGNGFAIQTFGTTMISGNNIIPAMAIQDVSRPGTAQFGLNLVANTTPLVGTDPQGTGTAAPTAAYSVPNFYKFVPGDVVASVNTTDEYKLFTSSYIVNIVNGQPVGVYVATLTYLCLANF